MRVVQFIALVLTALALVPAGAHLAALPNKIGLGEASYFIAQSIYRGWALFGIVLFGALIANLALAVVLRAQRAPLAFALIAALCLAAMLAIFFAYTYPANEATANWTMVPDNWRQLRRQWEYSHAVNAAVTFAGFCSVVMSVLLTRQRRDA